MYVISVALRWVILMVLLPIELVRTILKYIKEKRPK